jgi:outer membrane receptor protein involved in Fe transport
MNGTFKQRLLLGAAGLGLMMAFSASAIAQDASPAADSNGTDAKSPVPVEKVVVYGTAYRNRTNDTAPSLNYGLDYFQKFEPLTAGDALKRVPSVTFQSDVLEYDGVRLRGLDPGYTQILINGEQVPGSGVDRSFFVDRIPAELIERVEIVRSASADRSGDAVAGAINIILRDALSLDGGYVKAGGLRFDDGDVKGSYGAVYGTEIMGGGRILLGGNIQGRHNPKQKVSLRYDDVLAFDNREDQSDVRDGTDYSLNGSLIVPVGLGELDLTGSWVRTDRTETENSREYDDIVSTALVNLQETSDQFEDILQENWQVRAKFTTPLFGGKANFKVGYASFEDDNISTEFTEEWVGGAPDASTLEGAREFTDMVDGEVFASISQLYEFESMELKFGADWRNKSRTGEFRIAECDDADPCPIFPVAGPEKEGDFYDIEETRFDPYLVLRGNSGAFAYEAGLRYETTTSEVTERTFAYTVATKDFAFLLPSAHVLFNVTEDDRIRASAARTVRRPSFDQLTPALLEEEPTEDNDLVGNPSLKPESAWGFDLGYEHRIGRRGVAGINFFYRDVSNRIELASTGVVSSEGSGFVLTPTNVGNGSVMGVEIDLSTPLTFIGMENTGVFMNYSWLDSEITDLVTGEKRRFNDQAEFVFNIGFIHDIVEWGTSFGSSYRLQGDQFNRILGETVETTYGADLEVFVEQRFGERFVLRLTGSNLLNAKKDETFFKYDTQADQLVNAFDEFELESEQSGPVFQLVGRYAF